MFGRAPKKSGVDKSASSDELKKAYHKAAIKNHPDKGSDPEKFKELTQAYEVLSDPEKREVYYQCGEDALKEGMGGGGSNNPFDIFESFFGDAEMDKSNEELCKTKLLYSTTIPTLKDQEVVDDEESQSACAGMDVADLPQDDGVWSPMLLFEEMAWDSIDETEKACSDRMMPSTSGTPIFSKVFAVGHGQGAAFVAIPNTYKPSKGSPSKLIKAQPTLLEDAINATQRIKICYKDTGGNDHTSYATGFAVSSTVMLTAKHVVDKQTVTQIRTFGGINVPANIFETTASMEGKDVLTTSKPCSRARDTHGLFLKGADVGCFTTKGFFNSFLLPCSPTFLSTDTVAILSFPGVDKFLKNAKWELIKDNASKSLIWKQYLPAMQSVYESTTREYAATHGIRKSKAKALDSLSKTVSKEVKKKLYDALMKTFGIGHTGNMLCSVGHILCRNKAYLGTSCSTLAGSSGAAVVPLCRPGEFVGIQRGGCEGYDLNCTTSTDNQEFVEFYMSNALPTLPHPNNSCWTNRRIDGFHHWLRLHGVHIPISSPWRGVLQGKNELKSSKRKALWA